MSQEISVSYQAVKSKVHKLIDAAVEGEKTDAQIRNSMERWWKLIHPADRVVAPKYLLRVLERSSSARSRNAVAQAFLESSEYEPSNGEAPDAAAESRPFHETHVPAV